MAPATPQPAPPRNDVLSINGKAIPMEQVARFAPIVQFHPAELYLPCSVEFLLHDAILVNAAGQTITTAPTQADLQAFSEPDARLWLHRDRYAGEPLDAHGSVQAPMYVSVQVPNDHTFVDLNYIFLFAYNGPQGSRVRIPWLSYTAVLPHFAEHEGDIEGISVRIAPDFSGVQHVRLEGHGRSRYVPPDNMTRQGDRPVLRSGLNSHASYDNRTTPWAVNSKMSVLGFGVDFVDILDHSGPTWAPGRDKLIPVGLQPNGEPVGNQTWAAFSGRLGARWRNRYAGARGVGERHLASWQHGLANIIAGVVDYTGVSLLYAKSDGTRGLHGRRITPTVANADRAVMRRSVRPQEVSQERPEASLPVLRKAD